MLEFYKATISKCNFMLYFALKGFPVLHENIFVFFSTMVVVNVCVNVGAHGNDSQQGNC